MTTLGVNDGHDAGACLLDAGRIVAAVSEERLTGRKRQAGFPRAAIRYCLRDAGLDARDVHRVLVAERSGRALHRLLDRRYRQTDPCLPMNRRANRLSMIWQNAVAQRPWLAAMEERLSLYALRRRLHEAGIFVAPELVDHHRAHALGAACCSGFADALVVTMDAFGDGRSATVWRWREPALTPLQGSAYPHSLALLYGLTTAHLGFVEGDEGKTAGLAARGNPEATAPIFATLLTDADDEIRFRRFPTYARLHDALAGFSAKDVAAGLQQCLERHVGRFVSHWLARSGARRLCLAGGLFANVKLNQVVGESGAVDDLFVFAHMGDGGLCVGAALAGEDPLPRASLFNPFLGPAARELTAADAQRSDSRLLPLDDATDELLAELLARGEAIGLVDGRLEFGPRALGRRSILFSAQHPATAQRVSAMLNRPAIMPFAPVVRVAEAGETTTSPLWTALRFMTATVTARAGVAERFPVAVHADGSMRLQTIDAEGAPQLDRLLRTYGRRVQPGLLINTSFNRHTAPIVADTEAAVELYRQTPLAALVGGATCLVKRGREAQ